MSAEVAFLFPGQGSQKVGMGRAWAEVFPAAREVFAEADRALGFALSELCWQGPEDALQLTANAQPAILACSTAMHRAIASTLTELGLEPAAMAGHSLGEYSALVAAGALDFATALELVRRRGELMQAAVPVDAGAMAAVMGLEPEAVEAVTREAGEIGVCAVANLNSPQQTVIAGERAAVERAVELATERGAKRAKLLAVSAPFHSPLMRPAREALEPLLEAAEFRDPAVPVWSNVDAAPVRDGDAARRALGRQVDGTVRWSASIRGMIDDGVEAFLELGEGNVLTGLGRRIDRDVRWLTLPNTVEDPAAVTAHLRKLAGAD